MQRIARALAALVLACGLLAAPDAFAWHGGGHGGGGWGWHGGGWHGGGWGWGGWGWGYPYGYGWPDYGYGYPYGYYGYDYPPPPSAQPTGGLYCVTRAHLCALSSARAPGASCSCSGTKGRVSVLQGQE